MLKEAVMSKKSSNKTLNKGNPTSLHHIKDAIMEWINGKHENGMALSTQMVILRVSRMDPTFRDKKVRSRYSIIRCFLRLSLIKGECVENILHNGNFCAYVSKNRR